MINTFPLGAGAVVTVKDPASLNDPVKHRVPHAIMVVWAHLDLTLNREALTGHNRR